MRIRFPFDEPSRDGYSQAFRMLPPQSLYRIIPLPSFEKHPVNALPGERFGGECILDVSGDDLPPAPYPPTPGNGEYGIHAQSTLTLAPPFRPYLDRKAPP